MAKAAAPVRGSPITFSMYVEGDTTRVAAFIKFPKASSFFYFCKDSLYTCLSIVACLLPLCISERVLVSGPT
jgi:hypothetical protein